MGLSSFIPGLDTITAGLKALAALCGFGEKVVSEIHDANKETDGVNRERATENAAAAKVNENVAKAAVSVDDAAALKRLHDGRA